MSEFNDKVHALKSSLQFSLTSPSIIRTHLMGNLFATPKDLPNPLEYCKVEKAASEKCMKDHNYDREKYKIACVEMFVNFYKCKERWRALKGQMMIEERKKKKESKAAPVVEDSK
ncbi:hypothetical protein HDU76_013895 [Blyttiomyces sp. JEL0837]|nr:hypothetical protein HDU76_013895 [Blyttiomyces sp. JEL0837]